MRLKNQSENPVKREFFCERSSLTTSSTGKREGRLCSVWPFDTRASVQESLDGLTGDLAPISFSVSHCHFLSEADSYVVEAGSATTAHKKECCTTRVLQLPQPQQDDSERPLVSS